MTTNLHTFERVRPSIVHKEFEDDVLICNGRGALPTWLDPEELGRLPKGDTETLALILSMYRPADQDAVRGLHPAARLFLRSVPVAVAKSEMSALTPFGIDIVRAHYDDAGDAFVVRNRYLREADAVFLMNRFVARDRRITDFLRYKISAAIDALPGLDRPQRFYANMVIDTKNYFFYRKHHEHVPGIMLIEVARQAMYAQFYRYSGYERGSVSLTINYLHVDYFNFANANIPVRICVEDIRDPEMARSTEFEERQATFYQANRVIATVYMNAAPIRMQLFRRLRNARPPEGSRFFPVKNIVRRAMLIADGGRKYECLLHDLSTGGFKVTFDSGSGEDIGRGDALECIFFVEGPGYIDARVEVCWKDEALNGATAGLRIVDISAASDRKLRETIRNYTFLNTNRETV